MLKKHCVTGALLAMSIIASSAALAQVADAAVKTLGQSPLQLFVTLPVKHDHLDGFLATMHKEVAGARSEAGNIAFAVYEDVGRPSTLYLFEHWVSDNALEAHSKQPYYKAIRSQEADDLAGGVEERKLSEAAPTQTHAPNSEPGSYTLLTSIRVHANAHTKLLDVFAGSAAAIRSSRGNRGFWLYRDQEQPLEFLLIESWTERSARADARPGRQFRASLHESNVTIRETRLIDRSLGQD